MQALGPGGSLRKHCRVRLILHTGVTYQMHLFFCKRPSRKDQCWSSNFEWTKLQLQFPLHAATPSAHSSSVLAYMPHTPWNSIGL